MRNLHRLWPFSLFLFCLLSGLCLLLFSPSLLTQPLQPQTGIKVEQQNQHPQLISAREERRLKKKLTDTRRIRVIARLKQQSTDSSSKQKLSLDVQQQRFARSLKNPHSRYLAKTKVLPLVVMEVDASGFKELLSHPQILSVEEDRLLSPLLSSSMPVIGANTLHNAGITGNNQTLAILDTGVDAGHDFLSGKVVAEACFSSTYAPHSATSVCPFSDIYAPGSAAPCSVSRCDHGTHVAGIAVGNSSGNGAPSDGVAKDADLIAVQVFSRFDDSGMCGSASTTPCILAYTSDIIAGLEYVYSQRNNFTIAAANLSLGGGSYNRMFTCDAANTSTKNIIDLLRTAGIATVISAGNDGNNTALNSPGCISSAISTGSSTDSDNLSGFSNAASWLPLVAPGSGIISSVPGGYQNKSGTSMAAPHVAGAFALLAQAEPASGMEQRLAALTLTGVDITLPGSGFIKPRINLVDAVNALQASSLPPVDLILDDDYHGAPLSGTFSGEIAPLAYGGSQRNSTGTDSSYRFTLQIPVSGIYRLSAWWQEKTGANQASFHINHAQGLSTVELDQSSGGGNWFTLGSYSFTAGNSHNIDLSASLSPLVVDALRLELINPPPLAISTQVLPDAIAGEDYQQNLTATGGLPPYSWSALDPLPAGLSLSPQGLLSGIPETGGNFSFQIQLSDQVSSTSKTFDLVISQTNQAIEIIIDNNDSNTASSGTWLVSGGQNPWSSNSLYSNSNGSFSWLADIPTSGSYQVYAWWTHYSTRSTKVPYTIAHDGGNTIVEVNQQNQALASQWILLGSFDFSAGNSYNISVNSSNGQANADAIKLVTNAAPQALTVTPFSLPTGQVGSNYHAAFSASGGNAPYSWSSTSTLPSGLTLESSGILTGVPLASGSWPLTIQVLDQQSNSSQADFTLEITPAPLLEINTTQLPDALTGQAYTALLSGSGGVPPYSWSHSGDLPPDLILTDSQISGVPLLAGLWNFDIIVTDNIGQQAQLPLSIAVNEVQAGTEIIIDNGDSGTSFTGNWLNSSGANPWGTSSLYNNAGSSYRWTPDITQANSYLVYAWWTYHSNRSATVPYSVSHDNGVAVITTAQNNSALAGQWYLLGEFDFSPGNDNYIQVSSENGQASADAVKLVPVNNTELAITSLLFPDGSPGQDYQANLTAAGGQPPYLWSITGVLPNGLTFGDSGFISGIPQLGGTFNFTLTVTDQLASQVSAALSITISEPAPLLIDNRSLNDATVNESYQVQLTASGGYPPYSWGVAGTLPDGLTLNNSGLISGIATQPGSWNFDIFVSDQQTGTDQVSLELTVLEQAPAEIIIDNLDSNTGKAGSWTTSSGPQPWQGNSVYSNSSGAFSWYPQITSSGNYRVYAWWTYHNNRADNVPYTVSYQGGSTTVEVNQHDSQLGGQWNLLGEFPFSAGEQYVIEVSSSNGQASADAVRLVKVSN
ncbi:putative Ig domain-containing protein [Thalassomonas actiniarum]|uniref:S8 family serine peptidase n=1 Tax=Thalassomonas actiniarum TaxID=485447 RepID=A0AAF0C433_9GAMM|nr:putative Ig domain-containing protein [Thalassomonas actiniarum]WDD99369.1 S8 family serine peptidase [Thalassomonas actiniarum]